MKRLLGSRFAISFGLLLLYIASGRLGLAINPFGGFATLIWPPTGLALAGVILLGAKLWPVIFLGAFLVNFSIGAPASAALGMACGNTLEALVAQSLLARFDFKISLQQIRDVVLLTLCAALFSSLFSASIGTACLYFANVIGLEQIESNFAVWWVGDCTSDLVFAPLILVWVDLIRRNGLTKVDSSLVLSRLLLAALLGGASILILSGHVIGTAPHESHPKVYLLFPLLVFGVMKFGPAGAVTSTFITASVAIMGVLLGLSPFVTENLLDSFISIELFLGVSAVSMLLLAAALAERQKLQDQALQRTLQLEAILEHSAAAIFIKDRTGRYQFINRHFEFITNTSRSQIIGHTDFEIFPKDAATIFQESDKDVLRTGKPMQFEQSVPTSRHQTFLTVKFPYPGAGGLHEGVGGISTDITERKQREQFTRYLADAGRILVSTFDINVALKQLAKLSVPTLADCCLIEFSKDRKLEIAVAHLDPSREQVIGENIQRIMDVAIRLTFNRIEFCSEIKDRPTQFGLHQSKSDEFFKFLKTLGAHSYLRAPLIARDQIYGTIILIFSDSDRSYDTKYSAVTEEIALRIGLAIDNAILFEKAQEAVKIRDEFVGIVSHDLKNPLATIALNARIIERHLPESLSRSGAMQAVTRIKSMIDKMNRLISELLDIAKIRSGKLVLECKPCSPTSFTQEIDERFQALAREKSIELTTKVEPNAPIVSCEFDRVMQVLSNLIGNAVKFTPVGGQITVQLQKQNGDLLFSVLDSGRGVPPSESAHLFEPFWQSRDARKLGTGLGLSIAKAIVDAHGGKIWLAPRQGAGAHFCFTLPVSGIVTSSTQEVRSIHGDT